MTTGSVWTQLEDDKGTVARLEFRSTLMLMIRKWHNKTGKSSKDAAKALGISEERFQFFMAGQIDQFSCDELVDMTGNADIKFTVTLGE